MKGEAYRLGLVDTSCVCSTCVNALKYGELQPENITGPTAKCATAYSSTCGVHDEACKVQPTDTTVSMLEDTAGIYTDGSVSDHASSEYSSYTSHSTEGRAAEADSSDF